MVCCFFSQLCHKDGLYLGSMTSETVFKSKVRELILDKNVGCLLGHFPDLFPYFPFTLFEEITDEALLFGYVTRTAPDVIVKFKRTMNPYVCINHLLRMSVCPDVKRI